MKQWIAFDAAGTLFEPAVPVERIYAGCFSKFGFNIPEITWKSAFRTAFQVTPDPVYAGDGEAVEKDWWRAVVRHSAEAAGVRLDSNSMDAAFEELFAHYARGAAWKLFPETQQILVSLKTQNFGLAVTSNFDFRLRPVITELAITDHFDFILTSADVGARKPSPLILNQFIEQTGSDPHACCLVGDSLHADGGAAEAAGIAFFHLDRPSLTLADFAEWLQAR